MQRKQFRLSKLFLLVLALSLFFALLSKILVGSKIWQHPRISGVVSMKLTGEPIRGATITMSNEFGKEIQQTETNPSGEYEFSSVRSYSYALLFNSRGYGTRIKVTAAPFSDSTYETEILTGSAYNSTFEPVRVVNFLMSEDESMVNETYGRHHSRLDRFQEKGTSTQK